MLALFVVETNKDNNSDWLYINTFLKNSYETGNNILRPVYLNGKGNYCKASVKREIEKWGSHFLSQKPIDDTIKVFYCIDTDDLSRTAKAVENKRKAEEIKNYCVGNGYGFIWFHEVIEQVFIGKRVSNNEKRAVARQFAQKSTIEIDRSKLRCNDYRECRIGTSNIDLVFSRFFSEKAG